MRGVRHYWHRVLAVTVAALVSTLLAPVDAAACVPASAGSISFGSPNSFVVQSTELDSETATAVLTCQIPILQLVPIGQYMEATVTSPSGSFQLTGPSGDTITFRLFALDGEEEEILYNQPKNLYTDRILDLLGLFGQSSAAFSVFARTNAANVASGVYHGTVTVNWSWRYCETILALGLCLSGWEEGSGTTVITLTLEVTPACNVTAPDINFGQAPMAGLFDEVTQEVAVTCTKDLDPFFVSMSNGGAPGGGRRAMTNGGNRLEYDLFKAATTEVWGPSGSARVANPAPADGSSAQLFPYTARIYADQDTPPPGTYSDNLTVEVVIDP